MSNEAAFCVLNYCTNASKMITNQLSWERVAYIRCCLTVVCCSCSVILPFIFIVWLTPTCTCFSGQAAVGKTWQIQEDANQKQKEMSRCSVCVCGWVGGWRNMSLSVCVYMWLCHTRIKGWEWLEKFSVILSVAVFVCTRPVYPTHFV